MVPEFDKELVLIYQDICRERCLDLPPLRIPGSSHN
jgi:hypothetical protein